MTALTREPSGEPRVDHRRRLVDAPAERRDDALDDARSTCSSSVKNCASVSSSLPVALDVDAVGAVDHDLGDRGVVEEALERPEAQRLVDDLADELVALGRR